MAIECKKSRLQEAITHNVCLVPTAAVVAAAALPTWPFCVAPSGGKFIENRAGMFLLLDCRRQRRSSFHLQINFVFCRSASERSSAPSTKVKVVWQGTCSFWKLFFTDVLSCSIEAIKLFIPTRDIFLELKMFGVSKEISALFGSFLPFLFGRLTENRMGFVSSPQPTQRTMMSSLHGFHFCPFLLSLPNHASRTDHQ